MRRELLVAIALAVLFPGAVTAGEQEKTPVELHSALILPGLPLPESDKGVYEVRLTARVDKKGEGSGTLELDPNAPTFDEFGYVTTAANLAPVKLDCTLKFVKKGKVRVNVEGRIGAPLKEVEWLLFEIQGPKITSRLYLATRAESLVPGPGGRGIADGRMLVHDKDGKVKFVVDVRRPPPPPPCHPGCFPAGTPIRVPDGTRPIERLREGDRVTTIGPGGQRGHGKVVSVFCTKNRLVEVRTDAGSLLTTSTQPLSLADGSLRAAGELKAGDRIYRWDGGARRTTTVRSVSDTGREEQVFNLILGEPAIFVADGFLARTKPPALAVPAGAEGADQEVPGGIRE
jgi:hypothetical protein